MPRCIREASCAAAKRPPAAILGRMLYLASQSPRRRELLAQLGITPGVLDVDVPEMRQPGESPEDYVRRVAREKAGAGLLQVMSDTRTRLVLGADTEVVLGDRVFGKPADADRRGRDAARAVPAARIEVITVVWLVSAGRELHAASRHPRCASRALTTPTIAAYVATRRMAGQGRRLCDPGSRGGVHRALCRAAIPA